jgi:threonine aldolase
VSAPRLHDPARRDLASDNCAGVHPEVLAALEEANLGHQPSYGEDVYTERLGAVVRRHFGADALAFPVFNGTGANLVALQAMASRWEAVVCAESAHLHTDECAAPEQHGLKLLTLRSPDGRLDPYDVEAVVGEAAANRHRGQPGVLSISQSTELGTCYTPDDISAIAASGHRLGLRVHLDGARLANAAASLGVSLRALTTDAGVDVVSLGATKNGGMFGDCVVVLRPEAVHGLPYLHKATTQLPSKTRFVSAQLIALLDGDLWLRNARAANEMAGRLVRGVAEVPGVRVMHPVHANAVFVQIPPSVSAALRTACSVTPWDDAAHVVRLMTAFDTEARDVDGFLAALAEAAAGGAPPASAEGAEGSDGEAPPASAEGDAPVSP